MQGKLKMKNYVVSLLKNNLSEFYYYHNHEHTLYVVGKAIEIGKHEECTEDELELLSTAALWHDTGYIRIYRNHEEESCLLARNYLNENGYKAAAIDKICGMIMATKIPQTPNNKLEEILADADLEYLGTTTYIEKANSLFKELQYIKPSLTAVEWNHAQVSFLQKHHYFTRFCKENREPIKMKHLIEIMER